MAEICKHGTGIAEAELVFVCDCAHSADRNCHWLWDVGDLAKSVTG